MSNSACARFGLKHYSATGVLRAIADMPGFAYEKIFKQRGSVGVRALSGTAIELGISKGLQDPGLSLQAAVDAAEAEFNRLTAFSTDPAREQEREVIAGMVEQGLQELRPYGVPSHMQEKIEWQHPDLPLPFIGFIDFRFAEHDIVVDLKTQKRLNSEISSPHAMQVSLYCAAIGQQEGRVTYVTPKKSGTYKVENQEQHLERLVRYAQKLETFLSNFENEEQLRRSLEPNTELFYYSDPAMKARVSEFYKF